jgi:hypothetical protein
VSRHHIIIPGRFRHVGVGCWSPVLDIDCVIDASGKRIENLTLSFRHAHESSRNSECLIGSVNNQPFARAAEERRRFSTCLWSDSR